MSLLDGLFGGAGAYDKDARPVLSQPMSRWAAMARGRAAPVDIDEDHDPADVDNNNNRGGGGAELEVVRPQRQLQQANVHLFQPPEDFSYGDRDDLNDDGAILAAFRGPGEAEGGGDGSGSGFSLSVAECNKLGILPQGQTVPEFLEATNDVFKLKAENRALKEEMLGGIMTTDIEYQAKLDAYLEIVIPKSTKVFLEAKNLPRAYLLGRKWYTETLVKEKKPQLFDETTTYRVDQFANMVLRENQRMEKMFGFGPWREIAQQAYIACLSSTSYNKNLSMNIAICGQHSSGKSYILSSVGKTMTDGIWRSMTGVTAKMLNVSGSHDLMVNFFDEITLMMIGADEQARNSDFENALKTCMTNPIVETTSILMGEGEHKGKRMMVTYVATHHVVWIGCYDGKLPQHMSALGQRWYMQTIENTDPSSHDSIVKRLNQPKSADREKLNAWLLHLQKLRTFITMVFNFYIFVGVMDEPNMTAFSFYYTMYSESMGRLGYMLDNAKSHNKMTVKARTLTVAYASYLAVFSDITRRLRFNEATGTYGSFFDHVDTYVRLGRSHLFCTRAIAIYTFSLSRSLFGNQVGSRISETVYRLKIAKNISLFDASCFRSAFMHKLRKADSAIAAQQKTDELRSSSSTTSIEEILALESEQARSKLSRGRAGGRARTRATDDTGDSEFDLYGDGYKNGRSRRATIRSAASHDAESRANARKKGLLFDTDFAVDESGHDERGYDIDGDEALAFVTDEMDAMALTEAQLIKEIDKTAEQQLDRRYADETERIAHFGEANLARMQTEPVVAPRARIPSHLIEDEDSNSSLPPRAATRSYEDVDDDDIPVIPRGRSVAQPPPQPSTRQVHAVPQEMSAAAVRAEAIEKTRKLEVGQRIAKELSLEQRFDGSKVLIDCNYVDMSTNDVLRVTDVASLLRNNAGPSKPSAEIFAHTLSELTRVEILVSELEINYTTGLIQEKINPETGRAVRRKLPVVRIVNNSRAYDVDRLSGGGFRTFVLTQWVLLRYSLVAAVKVSLQELSFDYAIPGRFITSLPKYISKFGSKDGRGPRVLTHRVFDMVNIEIDPERHVVIPNVDPFTEDDREAIALSLRIPDTFLHRFEPTILETAPAILMQCEPEMMVARQNAIDAGTPDNYAEYTIPFMLEKHIHTLRRHNVDGLGEQATLDYPKTAIDATAALNRGISKTYATNAKVMTSSLDFAQNRAQERGQRISPTVMAAMFDVNPRSVYDYLFASDGSRRPFENAAELDVFAERARAIFAAPAETRRAIGAASAHARTRIGDWASLDRAAEFETARRRTAFRSTSAVAPLSAPSSPRASMASLISNIQRAGVGRASTMAIDDARSMPPPPSSSSVTLASRDPFAMANELARSTSAVPAPTIRHRTQAAPNSNRSVFERVERARMVLDDELSRQLDEEHDAQDDADDLDALDAAGTAQVVGELETRSPAQGSPRGAGSFDGPAPQGGGVGSRPDIARVRSSRQK